MTTGYAEVNDTKLYYEIEGSGKPIVLLHGWTLDTSMWDDQFNEFTKHFRVLRYDLRGYGKSALPNEKPYTHHKDLKALLDHLKINQAALIGLSMGGTIAINFTLTYPEHVSALVIADSSIENSTSTHMAEFNRSLAPIFSKAREEGIESARRYWMEMPLFIHASKRPHCEARLKEIVGRYNGWGFVNDSNIITLNPAPEHRLHEIKAPTLIVIGALDDPAFLDIANILEKGIRGSEKVTMRDVGHMSNMEDPEGFNKIVLGFLSRNML